MSENSKSSRLPELVSSTPIDPEQKVRKPWQAWLCGSPVFFISLIAHLIFIALALYFVVHRFEEKRKPTFAEAIVAAPIRQHEEKILQNATARAQTAPEVTTRIVTPDVSSTNLPAVDMPSDNAGEGTAKMGAAAMGAGGVSGTGLGGGIPVQIDAETITASAYGLTSGEGIGLTGHFFDLKQNRSRIATDMTVEKFPSVISDFMKAGWPSDYFKSYFAGPRPLYLTQLDIPYQDAKDGPAAFKVQDMVRPKMWVVLYEGQLHVAHSGVYRFLGRGDDLCEVAIDHKIVLDGCLSSTLPAAIAHPGHSGYRYEFESVFGHISMTLIAGDWVDLGNGKDHTIQILIGEHPGGRCGFWLRVEQRGRTYAKTSNGSPLLPMFRLSTVKVAPAKEGCPPYDDNIDLGWSIASGDADGAQ